MTTSSGNISRGQKYWPLWKKTEQDDEEAGNDGGGAEDVENAEVRIAVQAKQRGPEMSGVMRRDCPEPGDPQAARRKGRRVHRSATA